MIQEPEDELMDQSLRETFSNFDLPPSSHVWAGIEGHLAALPAPARAVPYKLLLPLVGVVGMGVGWLLSGSDNAAPVSKTQVSAAPRTEVTRDKQVPAQATVVAAVDISTQPVLSPAAAGGATASKAPATHSSTTPHQPVPPPLPAVEKAPLVAPAASEAATIAVAEPVVEVLPSTQPVVSAAADSPQGSVEEATASSETLAVVAASAGAAKSLGMQKAESVRHGRTEYRMPSHRMAERGRGVRRRLSSLVQKVRHVFSPRRSKAAAQPDF